MSEQRSAYEPYCDPSTGNGGKISPANSDVVRAWDLPTRLFKWSLVALILTAWVSSGFDDPDMTVHKAAGYGILVLLVYRVLWGVFGSSTARFSGFVRPPAAAWAYLKALRRNRTERYLGHNPAGGLMVIGLLVACGVQVLLGLFSSDGVTAAGPFAGLVGDAVSSWVASIHAAWFYFAILVLAGLHIVANLYYQFVKREDLIGAMITGRKRREAYVDHDEATGGSLPAAAVCLLIAFGLVYGAVTLLGGSFFASI
ncbi:cytochrome b [Rhizobium sp. ERR 922]|uniref:cytochrome b/b6 domain-containing protein n=1 Tax=unclassified Rhizobium TaxID=2613769 RepID=UPI000DE054C6|nr:MULTISPECIES: cytochrome b/b6 domain-containing protein [unclassified Rhizobium]TWB53221.1 cytochrome b [Rhizobium sp. ERR 922]TWB95814.1 cytochrome b [Rhizobium sp. ERR 942]